MAVREVMRLPAPVLSRPAKPVGEIDDRARQLARDLIDTMRAAGHSVGIAAPQIGVGLRAFVADVTGHPKARSCHGLIVLFDPELLVADGSEIGREGCMSVPDYTGNVARATNIVIRGTTLDGEQRVIEADAFEARCLLHELDHLDGRLFLDRVRSPRTDVFRRRRYR